VRYSRCERILPSSIGNYLIIIENAKDINLKIVRIPNEVLHPSFDQRCTRYIMTYLPILVVLFISMAIEVEREHLIIRCSTLTRNKDNNVNAMQLVFF